MAEKNIEEAQKEETLKEPKVRVQVIDVDPVNAGVVIEASELLHKAALLTSGHTEAAKIFGKLGEAIATVSIFGDMVRPSIGYAVTFQENGSAVIFKI